MKLALLALMACVQPDVDRPETATPDTAQSGCVGDLDVSVEIETTEIATVLRARWDGEPTDTVQFTDGAGHTRAAPAEPSEGGEQAALLLGLRSEQVVSLRLARQAQGAPTGELDCGPVQEATAGRIPAALPETTLGGEGVEDEGGFMVAQVITAEGGYAAILDQDGQYVWASPQGGSLRAIRSRDGRSVLVSQGSLEVDEPALIRRVGLDGIVIAEFEVPLAHTDFVELPDGTIANLGWEVRDAEDGSVRWLGDTVLLISPTGEVSTLWSVFDWFVPDPAGRWGDAELDAGEGPPLEDWSHINGIAYSEPEEALYLTSSFNEAVLKVDLHTGELLWTLSDTEGNFVATNRLLRLPHSVQRLDDGTLLVFNRGTPEREGSCAHAAELTLDEVAGTASRDWTYGSETCFVIPALGEARRLEDESTLVTFSTAGQIDRVDAEGALLWRVNLDVGGVFGFGGWIPGLYPL